MSLTTCAVRARVYKQDGTPDEGATVIATLNRFDIDAGYVGPTEVSGVTDEDGEVTLDLWPNERGSTESVYRIVIEGSERSLSTTAVVPDLASVDLEDIAVLPAYPGRNDGELMVAAAIEASEDALEAASDAEDSATAAAASASTATTQASTATTQAGIATTQAGIATTQASTAITQAGTATTQAGIATTQAGIATTQASTATTQASTATTQASTATTQAGIATTQASTATTQAGIATTQAVAAAASVTTANAYANTATTQAGIATTQASTATTQAGIATTQAGIATDAATDAEAAYDAFDDRYLGPFASAPTLDNDGNAIIEGALYWDTALDVLFVRDGASAWVNPVAATAASVSNTPAGSIAATTVQAAIDELDAEKQPIDADLTALAGLTSAANKVPYFTGSGTAAVADFTAAGRTLVAGANAAAQRASLVLDNVDNTSDANKPVSTAQAAADAVVLAAAEDYADTLVVGLWDDRGNYDASVNTFPASGGSGSAGAVLKGDIWMVSVAGTLGGVPVAARQTVRALVDTPGQTAGNWAIALANTDIDDSISNGVTGRAPSQNAVFDALALKAELAGSSSQAFATAALTVSGAVSAVGSIHTDDGVNGRIKAAAGASYNTIISTTTGEGAYKTLRIYGTGASYLEMGATASLSVGLAVTGTLATTLATAATYGSGFQVRSGSADVIVDSGTNAAGYGYIGTSTNHGFNLRVNGSNIVAVTSVGATVTGTLSATGDLTLSGTDGQIKGGTAAGRQIIGNSDSSTYTVHYGPSHATQANKIHIVAGTTLVGSWDSTGLAVTGTHTAKPSTAATGIRLGVLSNVTSYPALSFNEAYASTTIAGTYSTGGNLYNMVPAGSSHFFGIADVTKLTLDTTGNLGLGVTPSSWASSPAIDLVGNAAISGSGAVGFSASFNRYYNAGWKYKGTNTARAFVIDSATFIWYDAASGTAGNAITDVQRMNLSTTALNLFGGFTSTVTNGNSGLVLVDSTNSKSVYFNNDNGALKVFNNGPTNTFIFDDQALSVAPTSNNADLFLGNQSGSFYAFIKQDAGVTGKVRYNSHAGSGTSHGHQFEINGTSKVTVDNTGRLNALAGAAITGTLSTTGTIGIGSLNADHLIRVTATPGSGATGFGVRMGAILPATMTASWDSYNSVPTTPPGATLNNFRHFAAESMTLGASGVVTNQYGFSCASITGATNNYAFWSNMPSGTARWAFYGAGTAPSALNGNLIVGSLTDDATNKLQVTGDTLLTGALAVTSTISTSGDTVRIATEKTPASAGATGVKGDVCWDASYLYVCTATNTWRRTAHATW